MLDSFSPTINKLCIHPYMHAYYIGTFFYFRKIIVIFSGDVLKGKTFFIYLDRFFLVMTHVK